MGIVRGAWGQMGGRGDIPTEMPWFQCTFLFRRVWTSSLTSFAGLEVGGDPYRRVLRLSLQGQRVWPDALLYASTTVFSYMTTGTCFSRRLIGSASRNPSSPPCHLAVGVSSGLGSLQDEAPGGLSSGNRRPELGFARLSNHLHR